MSNVIKPDFVTEQELSEILVALDELRETGIMNMFESPRYIEDAYGYPHDQATRLVSYWMQTFGERNPGN